MNFECDITKLMNLIHPKFKYNVFTGLNDLLIEEGE